jgi:hypothetical protein
LHAPHPLGGDADVGPRSGADGTSAEGGVVERGDGTSAEGGVVERGDGTSAEAGVVERGDPPSALPCTSPPGAGSPGRQKLPLNMRRYSDRSDAP